MRKGNIILICFLLFTLLLSCKSKNHIDKLNVNIDTLKCLPNNHYFNRRGGTAIDYGEYRIWFNREDEKVVGVAGANHYNNWNDSLHEIMKIYEIDTVQATNDAKNFYRLSQKYHFARLTIDTPNKISFTYIQEIPEKYIFTLNDSMKSIYSQNKDFELLENNWFEYKE